MNQPVTQATEAAVCAVINASPEGKVSWLHDAASSIGVNIMTLIVWLGNNPQAMLQFYNDCKAGNIAGAISDLVTAWNLSHTPTPAA